MQYDLALLLFIWRSQRLSIFLILLISSTSLLPAQNVIGQEAADTTEIRRIAGIARKLRENYPDSMYQYVDKGLTMAVELDDKDGMIDLYNLKGGYYWMKSNYALAIENYTKALGESRKINKKIGIYRSLSNLGQAYSKLGDYPQAIGCFLKAIALGDSIHADVSNTYNSLGVAYRKNNNFDLASEVMLKALNIAKHRGVDEPPGLIGGAYMNLGNVFSDAGNYKMAMYYQQKALGVFDSLHQYRGMITCYNSISDNLISQKKYAEALPLSNKALEMSRQYDLEGNEAIACYNLARIAAAHSQYTHATAYLNMAITLAEKHQHRTELINFYRHMALYQEELGQPQKALFYQKKFIALKDSVYSLESNNKIANLRITFEIDKREKEIALLKNEQEITLLNRNISIAIASGITVVLFVFIFYQYSRITKNKQLVRQLNIIHQTEQQLIEVELENQKLKQQELEKEIERKSRELTTHALHILQKNQLLEEIKGELIGTHALAEAGIRKVVSTITTSHHQDKEWQVFKAHFEEVNPGFFERLVGRYPDLSGNDIKVCAMVKLNLGSKEISSIFGISIESVKMARYRLRKKLALPPNQNLVSFLAGF